MAKAGLLYTGQEEEVECTFCGCVLTDWQYGDQVLQDVSYKSCTISDNYIIR